MIITKNDIGRVLEFTDGSLAMITAVYKGNYLSTIVEYVGFFGNKHLKHLHGWMFKDGLGRAFACDPALDYHANHGWGVENGVPLKPIRFADETKEDVNV